MTYKPQLAEPIKFSALDQYTHNNAWAFEQKIDGDRRMIAVKDGVATGINRSGGIVPVTRDLAACFDVFNGDWLFDGELIDGVFCVFDLPQIEPDPQFADSEYRQRRRVLNAIIEDVVLPYTDKVALLPIAVTPDEKIALMRWCVDNKAEGIMAKRLDAPYIYGKHTQTMLKAKLWASIDCVITEVGRGGKRSIGVAVYEDMNAAEPDVFLGGVTVTEKRLTELHVGQVIEVKFLYSTEDRKLYQAAFLRVRNDKSATECTVDQLKLTSKEVFFPTP